MNYKHIILLISLSLTYALHGQNIRGEITGRVVDKMTNEPLVGANIVLVGTQLGAASNQDGKFTIERVPPGTYSVRAQVIGYKSQIISDVVVNPVKPAYLDFELTSTVLQLDELTVKSDYFVNNSDKPISTQFQSNEEIRRLPGGLEDVVRAISILPGVAQVQAGRNDLIVRGGAPSENLYVVDGLQVPNINHFGTQGASGGPQSFINLDFIERTQFSTGGFGVKYGDRLSSVLSLELREGREDRFGGKATLSATQFGLNLEGPIKDKGNYFFTARRSYLDFIFKAAGFAFVPEYWDFMGKVKYQLSPNNELSLLAIGALNDVQLFNDSREKQLDNSTALFSDQNQAIAGMTWKHFFGKGFSTLTLGQTVFDYRYQQNDTTLTPIFKNNSAEGETSLTGNLVLFPFAQSEVTAGMQLKRITLHTDLLLPEFRTNFGQQLNISSDTDTSAYKAASWVQWKQEFSRFRTTVGARIDYFNMIEKQWSFSPRLTLEYDLNLTTLSASIGRYTQAPSYIWLTSNPQNRSLDYIRVNQMIAGIEHFVRDDTKISLEAYMKKYDDYPVSLSRPYLIMANTGAGFGGAQDGFAAFGFDPLASQGKGESRGVELFVQKKLSTVPLYGTASLSYNESKFTALDGISRPGAYDQRWIFNIGGGYIFNEKYQVSTKFTLATGRPYTPFRSDGTKSIEQYHSARIPANHSLDIRLDRRWYLNDFVLISYIDIQNIYNRPYYSEPRWDPLTQQPENRASIGLLPSIGLSAEF